MLQFVNLRLLLCGTLAVIGFAQVGCVPSPPRDPVPPPLPTSSSSTIPGPPATIPGPPPQTATASAAEQLAAATVPYKTVVADESGSAIGASEYKRAEFKPVTALLQIAGTDRAKCAKELIAVLDSVNDDATATTAAAKLRAAGQKYAAAVKEFNAAMAAISLSGNQDLVIAYLQQHAAASPEAELLTKIEAAVNSPQGPILQPAINGLFDAWLQNATSGERRGLERLIEKQKLRR